MDNNTISAIIGFWRMGADMYQIEGITGVHPNNIKTCIDKHNEIIGLQNFLDKLIQIKNNANNLKK